MPWPTGVSEPRLSTVVPSWLLFVPPLHGVYKPQPEPRLLFFWCWLKTPWSPRTSQGFRPASVVTIISHPSPYFKEQGWFRDLGHYLHSLTLSSVQVMCSSASCLGVTGAGALVNRHVALWVFGNAITSLMVLR